MIKKTGAIMISMLVMVGFCLSALYFFETKLDLAVKGGSHLVLEVNTEEAVKAEISQLKDNLVAELNERTIAFDEIKLRSDLSIEITARPEQRSAVKELVDKDFPVFDFKMKPGTPSGILLVPKQPYIADIKEKTMWQLIDTLRNRVAEFGVVGSVVQREGISGNRVVLELPGLDVPERIKERLKTVAKLEWKEVIAGPFPSREKALSVNEGRVPEGMELLCHTSGGEGKAIRLEYYLLRKQPIVSGQEIKKARRGVDSFGLPAVNFSLSPEGERRFSRFTEKHIGDRVAIVLDNGIQSIPVVRSRISGEGQITGNFTVEEAEDLALLLRAGALPASINYIEEKTIGPSLDWYPMLRIGIIVAIIGLLAVFTFMLIRYNWERA
jgi:preprotein translocase subunit SecD